MTKETITYTDLNGVCRLYTSDAADNRASGDCGGR